MRRNRISSSSHIFYVRISLKLIEIKKRCINIAFKNNNFKIDTTCQTNLFKYNQSHYFIQIMARVISQKMKRCKNCGHSTLHQKNTKQMSWVMHIFLFCITLTFWFWIWLLLFIWHVFAKPTTALFNNWHCSQCGQ